MRQTVAKNLGQYCLQAAWLYSTDFAGVVFLAGKLSNLKTWVGKLSCTTLRVVIPTTRSVVHQSNGVPKKLRLEDAHVVSLASMQYCLSHGFPALVTKRLSLVCVVLNDRSSDS